MKEKLRERLLAVGAAIGYPFFYVCCLVVFASWTFPFEKVRDRIVASFNESQRTADSPRELAIGEISSSWITGLRLSDIRIVDREPGKSEPKTELKVDSLVARLEILPLLVGNHNLDFHAEAFGGKASGSLKDYGKGESFELTLEALDLGQLTPVTEMLQGPIEGSLSGTFKLDLPEDKIAKSNGTLAFEATDVTVGDGKAKLMGTLAIPKVTLGTFTVTGDVKDGTLKISKLGASGKDIDFLADARVTLREQTMDSFVDINMRFRVSDAYRGKNDTTKSIFGAPGSSIPGIIEMEPKMKQSKRADGFFTWHARGSLSKIEPQPGGTGGPSTGPGATAGGAPATPAGRAKGGP